MWYIPSFEFIYNKCYNLIIEQSDVTHAFQFQIVLTVLLLLCFLFSILKSIILLYNFYIKEPQYTFKIILTITVPLFLFICFRAVDNTTAILWKFKSLTFPCKRRYERCKLTKSESMRSNFPRVGSLYTTSWFQAIKSDIINGRRVQWWKRPSSDRPDQLRLHVDLTSQGGIPNSREGRAYLHSEKMAAIQKPYVARDVANIFSVNRYVRSSRDVMHYHVLPIRKCSLSVTLVWPPYFHFLWSNV